jgi:hypothetical protein
MDGIPEVGKLAIRHLVGPQVQLTTLLYRPNREDEHWYRKILQMHNGRVEECFGGVNYDVVEEMGSGSREVRITWCEATDEDLRVQNTMWGDAHARQNWLARLREREGRLRPSELERLEQVFGVSRQFV